MMVIMVAAFLGFGHHGSMMGGHGKETHNEATIERKQTKDESCLDCAGSGQDVPKEGVNSQDGKEAR
ncbi:MAG: hypothetical protein HZA03_09515 [Nitrospinae bacterium]|nr:hypothetical protein [Nitrospinota bacterium]